MAARAAAVLHGGALVESSRRTEYTRRAARNTLPDGAARIC
eukprot:CAMPEP_0172204530 /NCGR_PEP_ID=MMETSP1050-20130122/32019_1 /TAXON_ID=233186 /ORGANISM="Cryptomonas curvata, Strain CCAP979/52" /LENGTH=40 /DNA_ID= /DNA_START= /DNA_END= /DNA_ORIENTATION=